MKFINKLEMSLDNKDSHLCVGLDSSYDRIPDILKKNTSIPQAIFSFNKQIVDATQDLAVAYKANLAFYAGFGAEGLEGLRLTNEYVRSHYSEIPLFADCKRSEMGETVVMIEKEIFGWLLFDCVMVTPWFGFDTVRDYLKNDEHGVVIYVHDSNPTAVEIQELELKDGRRVYEEAARLASGPWNTNGNVIVEAGATYPEALVRVRQIVGEDMPILTAGLGIQGGKTQDISQVFGKNKKRLLANSSRGIIFAGEGHSDYFAEVRSAAIAFQQQLLQASKG
jgi:orotidine-5'-phosphate decarboxylase